MPLIFSATIRPSTQLNVEHLFALASRCMQKGIKRAKISGFVFSVNHGDPHEIPGASRFNYPGPSLAAQFLICCFLATRS
jgi:hypothetical protein